MVLWILPLFKLKGDIHYYEGRDIIITNKLEMIKDGV